MIVADILSNGDTFHLNKNRKVSPEFNKELVLHSFEFEVTDCMVCSVIYGLRQFM